MLVLDRVTGNMIGRNNHKNKIKNIYKRVESREVMVLKCFRSINGYRAAVILNYHSSKAIALRPPFLQSNSMLPSQEVLYYKVWRYSGISH